VVDFAEDGTPIGLEIVNPTVVSPKAVHAVLAEVNAAPVAPEGRWPSACEWNPLARSQPPPGSSLKRVKSSVSW
jgi:hypothetical protein